LNFDKLNNWLILGANLGVLIGLVFLIIEVQQNNQIARAEIRMDIADEMRSNIDMFTSQEGVSIQAKLIRGEELTLEDEIWLRRTMRKEIRSWESTAYQYSIGFLDEEEIEIYRNFWRNRASECKELSGSIFFDEFRTFEPQIRPSFRNLFNDYFDEFDCE